MEIRPASAVLAGESPRAVIGGKGGVTDLQVLGYVRYRNGIGLGKYMMPVSACT